MDVDGYILKNPWKHPDILVNHERCVEMTFHYILLFLRGEAKHHFPHITWVSDRQLLAARIARYFQCSRECFVSSARLFHEDEAARQPSPT